MSNKKETNVANVRFTKKSLSSHLRRLPQSTFLGFVLSYINVPITQHRPFRFVTQDIASKMVKKKKEPSRNQLVASFTPLD